MTVDDALALLDILNMGVEILSEILPVSLRLVKYRLSPDSSLSKDLSAFSV